LEQSLKLTSQKTNWVKCRIYISSHIELSPHLKDEANVDSFDNTLEGVLKSAARVLTPQSANTKCLRREWQLRTPPSARQSLRHASRQLTKDLQQKEAYVP